MMFVFPAIPCPPCRLAYEERMRFAALPGVAPEHAAAIRAFAESDLRCWRCQKGRRTLIRDWFPNSRYFW
jgi:hypothetical protein